MKKIKYKLFVISILACYFHSVSAQKVVTLENAIERALLQNPTLKVSEANIRYAETMVGTYKELPPASFEFQYGNIQNPNVGDYAFTAQQSFVHPKVHKARKQLLETYVKENNVALKVQEREVKNNVRKMYFQWAYFQLLHNFLKNQDTLYQQIIQKATLRHDQGESNILEKLHFETQFKLLQNRQQKELAQRNVALARLQYLLAEPSVVFDSDDFWKPSNQAVLQQLSVVFLEPFEAKKQTILESKNLEKLQLNPSYFAGFTNQSMGGTVHQFVVIGGLSIPLFKAATKARIRGFEEQARGIDAQKNALEKQLLADVEELKISRKSAIETIDFLKNTALPQAEKLSDIALKQYQSGETNYIEFQQLFLQKIAMQETVLQQQFQLKTIEAEMLYLLEN